MFAKEDMELIISAMYKDELRDISEKIKKTEASLAEIANLNSRFQKYFGKISLMWSQFKSIITREDLSDREVISTVYDNLCEKQRKYQFELEKLNLKKNEIECVYEYIVDHIAKDDLNYVQNLILLRSIQENGGKISQKTSTLQFLMQ